MNSICFIKLENIIDEVNEMSLMASKIVKEAFDPLIGEAQNDYMISKFQTPESIINQMNNGSNYYFVKMNGINIGFIAFYPKSDYMYLSKFYLYKEYRGMGYSRIMMDYVICEAKKLGLSKIELNVNKYNNACKVYEHLGFNTIRLEKNDIGNGFYMDDYVYGLNIKK